MGMMVNPLAGRLSDRIHSSHKLLPILTCGVFICSIAFFFANNFFTIFLSVGMLWLFLAPVGPSIDSQTLRAQSSKWLDYGRIRLWGSLTFVLASYWGGEIIATQSLEFVPYLLSGASAFLFVATLRVPKTNKTKTHLANQKERIFSDNPNESLLSSSTYRLYLYTLATLSLSHAALYGFASLHWKQSGITTVHVGGLWATGVIAEIILFAVNRRCFAQRLPVFYFKLAAAGGIVRWTMIARTTDLFWLSIAQTLHGATFAAMHLGSIAFIGKFVPPSKTSSATNLASALAYNMPMALAMPWVGALFIDLESNVFLLMSGLSVVGGLFTLCLDRPCLEKVREF